MTELNGHYNSTYAAVHEPPPPAYVASPWRDLGELNRRYLSLLAEQDRFANDNLGSVTLARLQSMAPAALDAIARCPYALFSLQLPKLGELPTVATQVASQQQTQFVLEVLMFIWHGLRSSPAAMTAMFDLDVTARAVLTNCSAGRLIEIAHHGDTVLRPRWMAHESFWADMINAAECGNARGLRRSILMGRQLLAAERVTRVTLH